MGRSIDFLNDRIIPLIFKTYIPILLASSVSIVTQVANTFMMGQDDKMSLYIIGLFLPFSFFATALIEGFQISTASTVAVEKGRNNIDGIPKIISNYVIYGTIIALIIAIIITILTPLFVNFFNVNTEAISTFTVYTYCMVFINILVVLDSILVAALRGYGLVKISSAISLFISLANILLIYIFVNYFQMGVFSIVLANLLVTCVSLLLCLYYLLKNKILVFKVNRINFHFFKLEQLVKQKLISIGVPVMISYILIFFSTFFFNRIIAPFGGEVVAGFGAAYRVQTMVLLLGISFGSAIGLIMNQNIGALKFDRSYEIYKKGLLWIFGIYSLIGMFVFLMNHQIATFLIADIDTAHHAAKYLKIIGLTYTIMGPMLSTLLVLEQIGKGLQAFLLNFLYFTFIVVIGWILTVKYQQVELFYWTISIMNLFGVLGIVYGLFTIKKKMNIERSKFQQQIVNG